MILIVIKKIFQFLILCFCAIVAYYYIQSATIAEDHNNAAKAISHLLWAGWYGCLCGGMLILLINE
jgi:hypothetical protein